MADEDDKVEETSTKDEMQPPPGYTTTGWLTAELDLGEYGTLHLQDPNRTRRDEYLAWQQKWHAKNKKIPGGASLTELCAHQLATYAARWNGTKFAEDHAPKDGTVQQWMGALANIPAKIADRMQVSATVFSLRQDEDEGDEGN